MKTYILTISKTFFKGHPRHGEETKFKEKFLSGEKIHTIRTGEHWKLVAHRVNNGTAILSIREWSGAAYRSKQVEIAQITKMGIQDFEFKHDGECVAPFIGGKSVNVDDFIDVCANDGLEKSDFLAWFKYPKPFVGSILHFTDFRYPELKRLVKSHNHSHYFVNYGILCESYDTIRGRRYRELAIVNCDEILAKVSDEKALELINEKPLVDA